MRENNIHIKAYYTDDCHTNDIINSIYEDMYFSDGFGLGEFDGEVEFFPDIVVNWGGYRECYSREIPRDNKIIDFYIPEHKGLQIIGHFYYTSLDKLGYLEMFFANIDKDYNNSEYRKMCYSIDTRTLEDYENGV